MKLYSLAVTCALACLLLSAGAEELRPVETTVGRPSIETLPGVPTTSQSVPSLAPAAGLAPTLVEVDDPQALSNVPFTPSIFDAVASGDEKLVGGLIAAGVSPNEYSADNDTPLCLALRNGQTSMAMFLVMHGADPNLPGLGGQSPVVLASLRRHPLLLKALLAAGGDPNKPFAFPLTNALLADIPDESMRWYMKREREFTPLMAASSRGDVEAVTVLMEHGADIWKHTRPSYRYALNFAAERRYLYVMRILLGRNPDVEPTVLVTVDLTKQKAWVEVQGETKLDTKVSTGRSGYRTPPGRFVVTDKHKSWISTIYKVPMPYFMRLNCGAIGLHSGYVTGRPASHGCIRLPPDIAKKMFELVSVGDEVHIIP